MAETRNIFVKSKMNKDLDERLLQQGEYRDGQNISVNKSEGPDEGVVENIIGNNIYSNFNFGAGVEIIGHYVDTNLDRIYVFATNYSDSSPDQLSAFAQGDIDGPSGRVFNDTKCIIAYIQGPNNNSTIPASEILVNGAFLNFSKTHPITGVDLIEDLLFFTDNRNQPRKINVEKAIADPATADPSTASPYYTNEDHISVAKFAPYAPISFTYDDGGTIKSSLINETEEYLPANSTIPVNGYNTATGRITLLGAGNPQINPPVPTDIIFKNINFPGLGYFKLVYVSATQVDFEYPVGSGNDPAQSSTAAREAAVIYTGGTSGPLAPTREPFIANDILQFEWKNPLYNSNYTGDENYLKDKFIRFSYRFEYDDGEYSLMAPFTQHAFIPKQFGYFLDSAWNGLTPASGLTRRDEKDTAESGIVKFMENQVSTIKMNIPLPANYNNTNTLLVNNFKDSLKVNKIQILAKESDGLAIKIIDEIDVNENTFPSTSIDRNYLHTYESNKPFKVLSEKESTRVHDLVPIRALSQVTASNRIIYGNFIEKHGSPNNLNYDLNVREKPSTNNYILSKEYPNHTIKQNRSYKIGVVLVDRYGRSSNVILRDPSLAPTAVGDSSTVYVPYLDTASPLNWLGNNLVATFNNIIPTDKNDNYPGLFNSINPTGYYSYKLVVQQQEQEYYNVYIPGACSGKVVFSGKLGTGSAPGDLPIYNDGTAFTNIVLYGDNINKVPKELGNVGPTEEIYGSTTLLYPRVVTKYLEVASNVTPYKPQLASSQSSQVKKLHEFTVNSIFSFTDLGSFTGQRNNADIANSSYPHTASAYVDPLYLGATTNPFVAQLETDFLVGFASPTQEDSTTPSFSKNLNVYETDPFKSKLDIYWETSTSGLIQNVGSGSIVPGLNDQIISGTSNLPSTISPPSFAMAENDTIGTWISDPFTVQDDAGSTIVNAEAKLIKVTNGAGIPYAYPPFALIKTSSSPNTYRYQISNELYFGANVNDRTYNIFTQITNASGSIKNVVNHQLNLSNISPSLTIPTNGVGGLQYFFPGNTGNPGAGKGSLGNPWIINAMNLTPSPDLAPGDSLGNLDITTAAVNGSASPTLRHKELTIIPQIFTGSLTSYSIDQNQTGNTWSWNVTPDISLLQSLYNQPLKFLIYFTLWDASGVGKSQTYSAYFSIG